MKKLEILRRPDRGRATGGSRACRPARSAPAIPLAFCQPVGRHLRPQLLESALLSDLQLDSVQRVAFLRRGVAAPRHARMPLHLSMPRSRGGPCDVADHARERITFARDARARGESRRGVGRPARARVLRPSSLTARAESRPRGRDLRRPGRGPDAPAAEPQGSRDPLPPGPVASVLEGEGIRVTQDGVGDERP